MHKTGIQQISEEREKQISKYHYSPEKDLRWKNNELLFGALAYLNSVLYGHSVGEEDWAMDRAFWKPENDIENLKKAGAFIAAEIDRRQLAGE